MFCLSRVGVGYGDVMKRWDDCYHRTSADKMRGNGRLIGGLSRR